jgi:hypothetical protein
MAAAIAHSKQRNIHLSRMLSDKQEADAVQRRVNENLSRLQYAHFHDRQI